MEYFLLFFRNEPNEPNEPNETFQSSTKILIFKAQSLDLYDFVQSQTTDGMYVRYIASHSDRFVIQIAPQ